MQTMFAMNRRQFYVLATIWIGVYSNYVCYSVIAPFFPLEAKKKGLSAEEYSLVFASYSVAQLIFSFAAGRSVSITKSGHTSMTSPVTVGKDWGQECHSLGSSGNWPLDHYLCGHREDPSKRDILMDLYHDTIRRRGRIRGLFHICLEYDCRDISIRSWLLCRKLFDRMFTCNTFRQGLTESIVTMGMMMGPPIGSFLYEVGGFPAPFISFGVTLVTTSLVATFSIPNGNTNEYQKLSSSDRTSSNDVITIRDYLKVLRLPSAILAVLCTLLNVTSDIFLLITLSTHLQQFNVTAIQTGFIYLCLFISYGISSPVSGKIADHSDLECILQSFGSLIMVVSFLLIGPAFMILKPSLVMVIIGLLLKGLGAGPLISCSYTSCLKAAKLYAGRESDFKTYTLVSTIISFSIPLG